MRFILPLVTWLMLVGRPGYASEPLLTKSLLKRMYEAGVLAPGDALNARLTVARLVTHGPAWTWALDEDAPRKEGPRDQAVTLVHKPSGHFVVMLDVEARARELLVVPGTGATLFDNGRLAHTLDERGYWRPRFPAYAGLPFTHPELGSATRVARDAEVLLAWRRPGLAGTEGWVLTAADGAALAPRRAFRTGDLLEFADGRRVVLRSGGAVEEIPVAGHARVLVATLPRGELSAWVAGARRAIEADVGSEGFPDFGELVRGEVVTEAAGGRRVWVGPARSGACRALLHDPVHRRFARPAADGESLRLDDGRTMHGRDGVWYVPGVPVDEYGAPR